MYFPIHNVPETFDKFVLNFIDCTDTYISELLYIHELLIVENGTVWC